MNRKILVFATLNICSFIGLANASLATANEQITAYASTVGQQWLFQTSSGGAPVKGGCWKKNRAYLSRTTISLAFELDLISWLDAQITPGSQTRYQSIYNSSLVGLENRMRNNQYRWVKTNKEDEYWTNLTYEGSNGHSADFKVLAPGDLERYKETLLRKFESPIKTAIEECPMGHKTPTRSLLLLVYLMLPYLEDDRAVDIVRSTVDAWVQAIDKDRPKDASKWLNAIAYLVSRFDAQESNLLSQRLNEEIRQQLIAAASSRIERILENKKISADIKIIRLWRYQSLISVMSELGIGRYSAFAEPVSNDPQINLSVKETVELLVLATRLAQEGLSIEAANILSNLLMWEIGTADTGLNLTHPIDEKNRITTPYPIWLALVPAYQELTMWMSNQGNQLTAEQYKTRRMFSRIQYVSGIAEEGFWINFENVVN